MKVQENKKKQKLFEKISRKMKKRQKLKTLTLQFLHNCFFLYFFI